MLASGGGSNLQSLLDRLNGRPTSGGEIVLVVSDRASARALERAVDADVAAEVVPVAGRDERRAADALNELLSAHGVELVALAGYLRLVPSALIERFRGRILNIHPALLPSFGGKGMYGMNVHRAVLEAGCAVTGATVHHVTERYDEGRAVAQWPVPVRPGDDAESLAGRVLRVEHVLYPLAIERVLRDSFGSLGDSNAASVAWSGDDPGRGSAPSAGDTASAGPFFGWTDDAGSLERSMRQAFGLT